MMVKQNQVDNITGAGFVVSPGGSVGYLSLENNQFRDIDGVLPGKLNQQAAIRLQASQRADIADNLLERVVRSPRPADSRIGIDIVSSAQVRVTDNRLLSVTAPIYTGLGAGIAISSLVGSFVVEGNEVGRIPHFGDEDPEKIVAATWMPLLMRGRRPPGAMREGMEVEARRDEISGSLGILIESAAEHLKFTSTAPVVKEKDRIYALLSTHVVDLGRLALGKNDLRADGNELDGASTNTVAVVSMAATHCGLSGNEIRSKHPGPLALVMAHHVGFNHNRLFASADDIVLIPTERYVVMGNMRITGNIRVIHKGKLDTLPPPWDALKKGKIGRGNSGQGLPEPARRGTQEGREGTDQGKPSAEEHGECARRLVDSSSGRPPGRAAKPAQRGGPCRGPGRQGGRSAGIVRRRTSQALQGARRGDIGLSRHHQGCRQGGEGAA
jgi:hypothetical protein